MAKKHDPYQSRLWREQIRKDLQGYRFPFKAEVEVVYK